MTRLEQRLGVGRSGALTARQLSDLLETTPRDVTRAIEALRRRGVPICSSVDPDNGGYYLAADADELAAYIWTRDRRVQHIREPTDALRETLAKMRENEKAPGAGSRQTSSTEGGDATEMGAP